MPDTIRAQRTRRPERMDDPALDPERHRAALVGLRRLNRLGRTSTAVWNQIAPLVAGAEAGAAPLRILDLATGGGDLPIALWRRASAAGQSVSIVGIDVSPVAVDVARRRASAANAPVTFERADALRDLLPQPVDVVISSLFLHHLDDDDAIALLARAAAAARRRLVVDDLARSGVGLGLVTVATRLVTRSDVVHHDGPASVRAAFTPNEITALAGEAGLDGAVVRRRPPAHLQLVWSRA